LEASTQVGPLVSAEQRERVEGYIAAGLAAGGRITTGGARPAGLDRGWFVQPTVFADIDAGSAPAREEIFGPVLVVLPYADDRDAVTLANDSDYGLGGTVWTADEQRGLDLARQVRTGTIGINGYALDIGAPFGGMKASGLGRELGPEALAAYQEPKSIYLPHRPFLAA
jgi:acyl-CoA reductase-like NAD-dependent aldehyde dehydrogenase